jgi:hypothetical protein
MWGGWHSGVLGRLVGRAHLGLASMFQAELLEHLASLIRGTPGTSLMQQCSLRNTSIAGGAGMNPSRGLPAHMRPLIDQTK